MCLRLAIWLVCLVLIGIGAAGLVFYRSNTYLMAAEAVAILAGGAGLALSRVYLQHWLAKQIASLDLWFNDLFHRELLEQSHSRFLEGMWQAVKPRAIKFLQSVGPSGIPFSPMWHHRIRKLRNIAEHDIPQLLRQ